MPGCRAAPGGETNRVMAGTGTRRSPRNGTRATVFRWECRCRDRPVLLATYDEQGRINIKVGDRYWHAHGQVRTVCPHCGAEHVLDLRGVQPPAR